LKGRDHIAVAVAPAALVLWALYPGGGLESAAFVGVPVAAALGALAPDIDHRHALIGNGIPAELLARALTVLLLVFAAGWYLSRDTSALATPLRDMLGRLEPIVRWAAIAAVAGAALLTTSLVVSTFLPHRGPTHSLAGAAIATGLACLACSLGGVSWIYGLAFGWGYLSHLMADLPSRSGLPWLLWPFVQRD